MSGDGGAFGERKRGLPRIDASISPFAASKRRIARAFIQSRPLATSRKCASSKFVTVARHERAPIPFGRAA